MDKTKEFFNPPIISALISIIVAFITKLREMLIDQGSFLNRSIFNSVEIVGKVQYAFVMLNLGAILFHNYSNAKNSRLKRSSLAGITIVRLIINPIIGGIILYFLWIT